ERRARAGYGRGLGLSSASPGAAVPSQPSFSCPSSRSKLEMNSIRSGPGCFFTGSVGSLAIAICSPHSRSVFKQKTPIQKPS
ncbi:hypothetical protein FS749_008967, partial [Ceratobasidium sp. UAMH 11750]